MSSSLDKMFTFSGCPSSIAAIIVGIALIGLGIAAGYDKDKKDYDARPVIAGVLLAFVLFMSSIYLCTKRQELGAWILLVLFGIPFIILLIAKIMGWVKFPAIH